MHPSDFKFSGTLTRVFVLSEMIDDGELILSPTRFLTADEMSSYIESVIMGLDYCPVVIDSSEDIGVVIDGSKRLDSINLFIKDVYELQGLELIPSLNGKKFSDLNYMFQRKVNEPYMSVYHIGRGTTKEAKEILISKINGFI